MLARCTSARRLALPVRGILICCLNHKHIQSPSLLSLGSSRYIHIHIGLVETALWKRMLYARIYCLSTPSASLPAFCNIASIGA